MTKTLDDMVKFVTAAGLAISLSLVACNPKKNEPEARQKTHYHRNPQQRRR